MTAGIWLGASYALGRPAPVDEPYPHICQIRVAGRMTADLTFKIPPGDCAACRQKRQLERRPPLTVVDPDAVREHEARRLGEREETE